MVLTILLGVESYITIDPVTRKGFHQVSTGKWTMNYESEFMSYFGDGLVTNYQYAWIDKAFDKVLEDIFSAGDAPSADTFFQRLKRWYSRDWQYNICFSDSRLSYLLTSFWGRLKT